MITYTSEDFLTAADFLAAIDLKNEQDAFMAFLTGEGDSYAKEQADIVTQRMEADAAARAKEVEAAVAAKAKEDAKWKTCRRCSGRGWLEAYRHVNNGICFKCGGEGRLKR